MAISLEEGLSKLSSILNKIHGLLQMEEFDEDLKDELSQKFPNYMSILENRKKDILKKDTCIVVTGETSAGKTSLINCLLGEKIFVASNMANTSKIYRIRNSEKLACKYYTKQDELKTEENVKDLKELKKLIKRGMDVGSDEDLRKIYFVDVLMPCSVLEGSVILVDTPGIGESKELDQILLDFLPDAVSFIFVVNARNAGGVQQGRLLEILTSIKNNIEKMPCFDPKEALFVTNQWDIVEEDIEDDDDEESEGGKEKTWRIIKEKLNRGWPIDEENIFRVSLKQVLNKTENEYSSEYKRFLEFLDRCVKANVHKRLINHFRFLDMFREYAETGIYDRLNFMSMSESEKQQEIEKYKAMIDKMESDCKKKMQECIEDCKYKEDRLTCELWNYLHSSNGKKAVLSPYGKNPIENVFYCQLGSEIPERVEAGVQRWCNGEYCKSIMVDAENRIVTFVKEMSFRIQECRAGIIGETSTNPLYGVAEMSAVFGLFFLSPLSLLFGILLALSWVPAYYVFSFFVSAQRHKEKVDDLYDQCIKKIGKEDLREKFHESFGAEYMKIIDRIFLEDFPKEIGALRVTLEKLELEHKEMKNKENFLKSLKNEIEIIRKEMIEMHVSLSDIIDQ